MGSIGQSDKPTDGFSRANLEAREKRDTLFRAVVILRVKNDRASTRRGFRERIAREFARASVSVRAREWTRAMRAHRPATSLLVRRLQLKRGVGKSSSSSSVSSLERESEATVGGGKSTTPAVTPTLKILAFEDSYDIRDMLRDGDVEVEGTTVFSQRWTSENCLEVIKEFDPDVLLLDYYMPPFTGLAVLKMVNEEVKAGRLRRPRRIVGMSSESSCNASMLREGADDACVKWDISSWNGWENR